MHKSFDNKILSITFGVLLILWLATKLFDQKGNERNFRTDLILIDTASVNRLVLHPKEGEGSVTFTQEEDQWRVAQGNITAQADQRAVQSVLGTLLQLKPQRLAARSEDKWDTFEVTDSLGTRLEVYSGEKLLADLYIGKFSLQQMPASPTQQGMPPMQQQRPKATSYVRLANEPEVYAIDGFLTSAFNQQFNSWRDRKFLQLQKENLTHIEFQYPADSSFSLTKSDSTWNINGTLADSAQIAQYLNQIVNLTSSDFADDFNPTNKNPSFQVKIEGENMNPVTIEGFEGAGSFVLRNSLKPDVLVRSDSSGLFQRIFKSPHVFTSFSTD